MSAAVCTVPRLVLRPEDPVKGPGIGLLAIMAKAIRFPDGAGFIEGLSHATGLAEAAPATGRAFSDVGHSPGKGLAGRLHGL